MCRVLPRPLRSYPRYPALWEADCVHSLYLSLPPPHFSSCLPVGSTKWRSDKGTKVKWKVPFRVASGWLHPGGSRLLPKQPSLCISPPFFFPWGWRECLIWKAVPSTAALWYPWRFLHTMATAFVYSIFKNKISLQTLEVPSVSG